MPTIEFTATPKLPDDYRHLGYVKGMRITDRQGWCEKWVSRGVAVFVPEEPVAEPAIAAVEPALPDDEPVVEMDKPAIEVRRGRKPKSDANE